MGIGYNANREYRMMAGGVMEVVRGGEVVEEVGWGIIINVELCGGVINVSDLSIIAFIRSVFSPIGSC